MIRCACPRCVRADDREAWGAWQGELFGEDRGGYRRATVIPFAKEAAMIPPAKSGTKGGEQSPPFSRPA